MNSKILIAVVGPTGIGKTKLGIMLAKHFSTEILSADSRQFFKEMRIGTAVPTQDELKAVQHHFIQHKSIFDTYSVGDFERDAMNKLKELFTALDHVVMVGGSGLYVDAVIQGLDQFPEVVTEIREALNKKMKEKGLEYLQKELLKKDPTYYQMVDIANPHRLIRALEVCISSGKPYSSFLGKKKEKRPFQTLYVGMEADRAVVYDRINRRVDLMMEEGLLHEVKSLHPHKELNALQTVGYRELFEYFDGGFTLDFAVAEIKKNTRRFAKRQLTWLRKNESILWVAHDEEPNKILNKITNQLNTSFNV